MPFKKGASGNPRGRPKGTPNKTTQEARSALMAIVHEEIDSLPGLLSQLDARERVLCLSKILPYCLPKMSETMFTTSTQEQEKEKEGDNSLEYWTSDELSWYIDTIRRVDERIARGEKPA